MNDDTLIMRQVNPSFIQDGKITSQVFRPTPKDENCLSCYNGDKIEPESAYRHFVDQPQCRSAGVVGVSKQECDRLSLTVLDDAQPFPEHCSIDFSGNQRNVIEKKAKYLKNSAEIRGWLYQAEASR